MADPSQAAAAAPAAAAAAAAAAGAAAQAAPLPEMEEPAQALPMQGWGQQLAGGLGQGLPSLGQLPCAWGAQLLAQVPVGQAVTQQEGGVGHQVTLEPCWWGVRPGGGWAVADVAAVAKPAGAASGNLTGHLAEAAEAAAAAQASSGHQRAVQCSVHAAAHPDTEHKVHQLHCVMQGTRSLCHHGDTSVQQAACGCRAVVKHRLQISATTSAESLARAQSVFYSRCVNCMHL